MSELEAALALAIALAREEGARLRAEQQRPLGVRGAGDHADADVEVEGRLRARLRAAFPWSWLGEETGREDAGTALCWVVDPNDGTTAYTRGRRGSSVSIGAVRDGVPVLGVVFAYNHPDDEGELFAWAEGCGPLVRDGRPVAPWLAQQTLAPGSLVLLAGESQRWPRTGSRMVAPARYLALPSIAFRLARVAGGDAVATLSLSGPSSWDYCAGHALLRGAGGVLLDESGAEVRYARGGASKVRLCFGGAPAAAEELRARPWAALRDRAGEEPLPARPLPRPCPRPRLARAQGCLLGQLAGDALGSRVEFQDPAAIAARFPDGVRTLADGGTWDTIAGQPTDDSELALALARSIVAGGYDPGRARAAYVEWLESEPFDVGATIGRALRAAARGEDPRGSLELWVALSQSKANGSLMRASPLGVLGAGRPAAAAAWAREDSALTHPNPACVEACAAFVAAIAAAVAGADARAALAAALAEARDAEVRAALEAARTSPPADFLTHQGLVTVALQNAFFQLLHAPSLEEGVVDTVGRGGDTDTNAAIAGALLGALYGRPPAGWMLAVLSCRPLVEQGARRPRPPTCWPTDALELAEALLAAGE